MLTFLSEATELGLNVSVVANGLLVDREIAKELSRLGVFAYLSLDGASERTCSLIRGPRT